MCSRLFRATPQQENPAGRQFEKKPTPKGRQAPSEPTNQTSQTLRNHRNAHLQSLIRHPQGCVAPELMGRKVCELGFCGVSEGWTPGIPAIACGQRIPWSATWGVVRGVLMQMVC